MPKSILSWWLQRENRAFLCTTPLSIVGVFAVACAAPHEAQIATAAASAQPQDARTTPEPNSAGEYSSAEKSHSAPSPDAAANEPSKPLPIATDSTRAAHQHAQARLLRNKQFFTQGYGEGAKLLQVPNTGEVGGTDTTGLATNAEHSANLATTNDTGSNISGAKLGAASESDEDKLVAQDQEPTAKTSKSDTEELEPTPIDAYSLGVYTPLGGAGAPALEGFYSSLRNLESGTDPGKVRIAFYGSSSTAADYVTSYLRVYLQSRFGNGGHGFVSVAKPWRTYRHLDVGLDTTRGWHTDHAQKKDRREDGYYGLLGLSTSATKKRDRSTWWTRVQGESSHGELYYLKQPKGGKFYLDLDGKKLEQLDTRSKTVRTGFHQFNFEPGHHKFRIRVRGNGEVRLFGMTLENEQPGVVVDTLGINGARATNHLIWDEEIWAEHIQKRAPQLFVLQYGANESTDQDIPIETYESELRQVIDRFQQAVPQSSCLLLGPGDFPLKTVTPAPQSADESTKRRSKAKARAKQKTPEPIITWGPRPRLQQIVEIQKRVAAEKACAFWDVQAFMGGPMSMTDWVRAEPTMGRGDHLHLSLLGYTRWAMGLTDALMQGFDGKRQTQPTP